AEWEQIGSSFYTNAGLAITAHNGAVLQATRLAGLATMGVSAFDGEDWVPYGNYPVSGLNGSSPDVIIYENTPYMIYENSKQMVVRKYEEGQWVQVGDAIPLNYALQAQITVDEHGTIYIAYLNNVPEDKNIVNVKKLVDDGNGNEQWLDVGNLSYFADKPVYGSHPIELIVEDRKVYIGMLSYNRGPKLYEPIVSMLDESEDEI